MTGSPFSFSFSIYTIERKGGLRIYGYCQVDYAVFLAVSLSKYVPGISYRIES